MAYLNTEKAIAKGAAAVHQHRRYDITVVNIQDIIKISEREDRICSMFNCITNGFNIGFIQGFKAATKAMKGGKA